MIHRIRWGARPLLRAFVTFAVLLSVQTIQSAPGIEDLYRLDLLPAFKTSAEIGSISSYDRTGGNDDGFSGKYSFVQRDPEGLVLADLKGPGVIYRFWTPTPSEDTLEFLFDGETSPRIEVKFRDFFLGKYPEFPRPLVGAGAGGYYSYVPMPFAKSCVVRMRAPKVQFYQINYALYAEGTPIATYTKSPTPEYSDAIAKARRVLGSAGADLTAFVVPQTTKGAKVQTVQNSVLLKPNETATVFQRSEGGRILGLRMTPIDAIAGKARDLTLRISFDGGKPSVLCPLGDFFGYAWGQPAMKSLLVGTSDAGNYCYFPMPYARNVQVELTSTRSAPVELKAEVSFCDVPRKENEGIFHAWWRRENPTKTGEPYTFLETTGRGHLVGVVLQSQGFESGKTLFFEGDDQTTIDGKLVIHGTGSEDFFNGGWYDVPDRWEKRISFPLSGCLGYAKHLGRTGAYRLFIGDAYAYRQSLKQTIEHSGEKNDIPTDYCSVAYFYSENAPAFELSLPPAKDRAVVDLSEVVFPMGWQTPIYAWSFDRATISRKKEKIGAQEIRYLSFAATGDDWFGPHFLSPVCDVSEAGRYAIYIEALKGPSQAKVQLFQDENPVAEPVDLFAEQTVRSGRLPLGTLDLASGMNNLMFKLVGKNERSAGLGLDLVQVICVREK